MGRKFVWGMWFQGPGGRDRAVLGTRVAFIELPIEKNKTKKTRVCVCVSGSVITFSVKKLSGDRVQSFWNAVMLFIISS